MTSLCHIAQALDSTAVRKIPAEPTGAAKIVQFHRRTNILHSEFTLKSRIQDVGNEYPQFTQSYSDIWCMGEVRKMAYPVD